MNGANNAMHAERPTLSGTASLFCLQSFSLIQSSSNWSGRRLILVVGCEIESLMPRENIQLVRPMLDLADAFRDFSESFGTEDLSEIHGIGSMMCGNDFSEGVKSCREHAEGINLPEGWVPASTWWLVRDNHTIVGTISLRHKLTPFLEAEGGHVGYAVHANERGRGYATHMLSCVMDIASEMGLNRLLIICEKDNPASGRVALKNGGVLEGEGVSSISSKPIVRYWIEVA